MLKRVIGKRKYVHAVLGVGIYILLFSLKVNLIYILVGSILLGIVFGKTFCRWICPLGFVMELMSSKLDKHGQQQNMYNYHKLGCPIAWIQGYLNRFSLFKIIWGEAKCTSCGLCDQACYITSLNPEYSFYEKGKKNPSKAFNCSKCLECVDSCPTNSLNIGMKE